MQKTFIPSLSNCRICMDQSLTGFYRVGQKFSDVIPVLRITPRATEPSTVSVFLSSVKCGRICRAQTCAHSGIEPSTLAKGFQRMGQKFEKKFEFRTIFSLYVPYISVTAKNRLTSSVCSFLIGTCEASRFYSNLNRTSRFDSKVTVRFENFESPRLPRLQSYHKQQSLFNDKFQSFRHCYWDLLPAIR